MARRYELTCLDCGGPAEVSRSDAKRCPSCMLLKTLAYAESKFKRSKRCRSCSALFRPATGHDYATCGRCQEGLRGNYERGPCALCKQPDTVLQVKTVAACVRCVRDPHRRPIVLAALKKGQAARRHTHADAWERVTKDPADRLRLLNRDTAPAGA